MKLSGETTIDVSAERVWEIIANQFARIGDWATAIPTSQPKAQAASEGNGPVAGRVCETGWRMFPDVSETIVVYDEAHGTLTYEAEGLPDFVAAARNRWQITPINDHRARVSFEGTVETHGVVGWLLRLPLRFRLDHEGRKTLADLKHYAEHGRPSPRKQRQLDRLARPGM